jgi:hypothetical protein
MQSLTVFRTAVILIGPLLLGVASESLRRDHAPYWRSSMQDTTYAYAFNALEVAELKRPAKVDHPGTTVEMLGAIVLRLRHFAVGSRRLPEDLLADPEPYCRDIHRVLLVAYVLVVLVSGCLALRATQDLGLAVTLQLTPLLAGFGIFLFNSGVAPEPLLLALASLLASAAFWGVFRRARNCRLPVVMGGVCGIGLATKWTFLPLCLLPLLLHRELRSRIQYSIAAGGAFALAMVPAWSSLGRSLAFAANAAISQNLYRSATPGLPSPAQYLNSLRQLLGGRYDAFFPLLLLLSVATVAWMGRSAGAECREPRRALLGTTIVCVLQILLAAKDPMAAKRYLVPAAGLAGLSAALLLTLLRRRLGTGRANRAAVILFLTAGGLGLTGTFSRAELRRTQGTTASAVPAALARMGSGCRVIRYSGSSSVEWALYHGNRSASGRFGPMLKALYPNVWFYDTERQGFFDFEQSIPLARLQRQGCLLLWGSTIRTDHDLRHPESWAGQVLPRLFGLTLVHDAGAEAVYRLGPL